MIRHPFRSVVVGLCLVLALTSAPGCTRPTSGGAPISLATMTDNAELAGRIAASGYIVAAKPTPEDIANVQFVLDLISQNLTNYRAGGFSSASHELSNLIDLHIPPGTNPTVNSLCKLLANTMLAELDVLFRRHPEWQRQGGDVAGIISAFTGGASSTLTTFRTRGAQGR